MARGEAADEQHERDGTDGEDRVAEHSHPSQRVHQRRLQELGAAAAAAARARYSREESTRVGLGFATYVEGQTPSYFATTGPWTSHDSATIRIEPKQGSILQTGGTLVINQTDPNFWGTQLKLLQSPVLARQVVLTLNLQNDPDFLGGQANTGIFSSLKRVFGKSDSKSGLAQGQDGETDPVGERELAERQLTAEQLAALEPYEDAIVAGQPLAAGASDVYRVTVVVTVAAPSGILDRVRAAPVDRTVRRRLDAAQGSRRGVPNWAMTPAISANTA